MGKCVDNLFIKPLVEQACTIKTHHSFHHGGTCYGKAEPDFYMDYWLYSWDDYVTISATDMYVHQPLVQNFDIDDFVCLYYYDVMPQPGPEMNKPLVVGKVAAFIGSPGGYTMSYLGGAPARGIAINILPPYYEKFLREYLPGGFGRLKEVFARLNGELEVPELVTILRQIRHCRVVGEAAPLYFQSKINEAVALVLSQAEVQAGAAIKDEDYHQLKKVEQYLARHYGDDVSLETLARVACMSVSKLKYTFKRVYDLNPSHYIRNLRIEKAKELLCGGTHNIAEIARTIGYKTPSALSKAFKEQTGLRPKDFRKCV